jgi:aminopeptidase N
MEREYDPGSKTLALTFSQSTPGDRNQKEKQPLHLPIRIGFFTPKGEKVSTSSLVELTSQKETFLFKDIPQNTLPSVFREFSAPIRLSTDFTDQELATLMAADADEFNQWDAAQTLFIKEIQQLVSAVQAKKPLSVSPVLVQAFSKALTHEDKDRAFLSKALALPQETEIKDHYDTIDVPAIHHARSFLKQELARQLKPQFLETFEKCSKSLPDDISHGAMADRSLKNLCLSFLGSLDENETIDMVLNQFSRARNMTDEFGALRILTRIDPETRDRACKNFYEKWNHQALVLDKWFAVQAISPLKDTFDQVQQLTGHKDFALTNPNKARALIYAFAMQNPIHFHRTDGKGYEFISNQILALDKINHQVAARLASCFNLWKRYDETQRVLMKNALETIISSQGLSKNVYEIVSRALE